MTSDNRIAKALEGILGQLTFVVAELRKVNKPAASGQTIPPIEEFDLERNKIAHIPSELDERLLSMPPNAARAAQGMQPYSQERLIPLPDKSYIVVDETFATPIFGHVRYNGTLYDRNGGEPVEICGQIVPQSINTAQAKMHNRPNVMDVLERWRTIDAPMNIEVINVHACDGEVVFYGHVNGQPLPGWQIQGIIKDVY